MNRYLPSVNQKRLFASLLLEQAGRGGQRHLGQALLQAAVDQLWLATRFYLMEVAESYQCPNADHADSPQTLVEMLAQIDKKPGEATEILTLSLDRHSWLSELDNCHGAQHRVPVAAVARTGEDLIAAVSMVEDRDWALVEADQVAAWLAVFSEMVERHRESMIEC